MSKDRKFNLYLEQYKLNEIKKITLNDENIEHLNYIEKDNQDFFDKFDIKKLVDDTVSKLNESERINVFPKSTKTIATFVAAAACFIISINLLPLLIDTNKEIIFLKGTQGINIYHKNSDRVIKLKNMDSVSESDKLQITYTSNDKYGVIFSVDGLNNITYHYPETLYSSTKLETGKEVTLPTSYVLDSAPFFEKFYMISSEKSFDYKLVNDATNKIVVKNGNIKNDIVLPKQYNIRTVILIKE